LFWLLMIPVGLVGAVIFDHLVAWIWPDKPYTPPPDSESILDRLNIEEKKRFAVNDEDQKIYEEAERLKKKAVQLFLPSKVWYLYEEIKNYPSWKTTYPDHVCNAVGEVSEFEETLHHRRIMFNCDGIQYEFCSDSKDRRRVHLTLNKVAKTVFKITMWDSDYDRICEWPVPKWELSEIDAYFDGDWVKSILKLSDTINWFNVELKKNEEEAARLKKLKGNFGSA